MLPRLETSVHDLKKGREDSDQSTMDLYGDRDSLEINPRSSSFGGFCSKYALKALKRIQNRRIHQFLRVLEQKPLSGDVDP